MQYLCSQVPADFLQLLMTESECFKLLRAQALLPCYDRPQSCSADFWRRGYKAYVSWSALSWCGGKLEGIFSRCSCSWGMVSFSFGQKKVCKRNGAPHGNFLFNRDVSGMAAGLDICVNRKSMMWWNDTRKMSKSKVSLCKRGKHTKTLKK